MDFGDGPNQDNTDLVAFDHIDTWLDEQRVLINKDYSLNDEEATGLSDALDGIAYEHVKRYTSIMLMGGGTNKFLKCPTFDNQKIATVTISRTDCILPPKSDSDSDSDYDSEPEPANKPEPEPEPELELEFINNGQHIWAALFIMVVISVGTCALIISETYPLPDATPIECVV
jgi:hypothetical protein